MYDMGDYGMLGNALQQMNSIGPLMALSSGIANAQSGQNMANRYPYEAMNNATDANLLATILGYKTSLAKTNMFLPLLEKLTSGFGNMFGGGGLGSMFGGFGGGGGFHSNDSTQGASWGQPGGQPNQPPGPVRAPNGTAYSPGALNAMKYRQSKGYAY